MKAFRTIVISGASRGLGAALARRFAAPGVRLLLIARTRPALEAVAAECASRGAAAEVAVLDMAEAAPVAAALARFAAGGPVDLVVANAGVLAGTAPEGGAEDAADAARQVSVNLLGAMHLVGPLLPGMLARGQGAVALVASLAAFRGLPDSPGYCASKAGLLAWGEALRAAHARQGLRVTVICPGFFDSAMGARHLGRRPLTMSLEDAAARCERAIRAGRALAAFPPALAWALRLLPLLPAPMADRAVRLLRFRIRPEPP